MPVPARAVETEKALAGLPLGEALERIGSLARDEMNPRDSWRASRAFRLELIEELSARALARAAEKGGAAL